MIVVSYILHCVIFSPMLKVGDLGRSSIEGKGVRIDVRRGLRFHSPEAICSGTTSKVSQVPTYTSPLHQQDHCSIGKAAPSAELLYWQHWFTGKI